MCRYAAYLGPPIPLSAIVFKPAHSLVHQATEATRSPTRINADGFGVGWYAPGIEEPAVFKDTRPMWNNRNLGDIAGKISSHAIAAHVRSAKSYDPVTRENCHPFRRGNLLWMHNGDIPGRARLKRQVSLEASDELLAMMRGNTDTEAAFTLFLSTLSTLDDPFGRPSLTARVTAMEDTIARIAGWHLDAGDEAPLELNFCLLDGRTMLATRFAVSARPGPTLFWCRNPLDGAAPSVLIASEPLFERGEWHELANGELLIVDESLDVEQRPLAIQQTTS